LKLNAVPAGSVTTDHPSASDPVDAVDEDIITPSGVPTDALVTLTQTETCWPAAGFMGLPPIAITADPAAVCLLEPPQPIVLFPGPTPPGFARIGRVTVAATTATTNNTASNLIVFMETHLFLTSSL
jgi:hypothetical protein